MQPVFITGIGTDVGKTVVSAIVTEALRADYWKPVQAGYDDGTDSEWVTRMLTNKISRVHPELFRLKMAASPHIAAKEEKITISVKKIAERYNQFAGDNQYLIIEGAGGLMVPLNENEFVSDLIKQLQAKVILVSRNYLGSINHSLLTAAVCKQYELDVAGWIFNDNYMYYEEEIVKWTGYPKIGSVNYIPEPDKLFIKTNAENIRQRLMELL